MCLVDMSKSSPDYLFNQKFNLIFAPLFDGINVNDLATYRNS